MTTLAAVNYILRRVGIATVAALESGTTSVAGQVEDLLNECNLSVQGEGWHFNKRTNVTLTPDGSSHILLAAITDGAVIEIDSDGADEWRDVVQSDDRLFDRDNNVDTFSGTLLVKYTVQEAWAKIPPKVQELIAAEAAVVYNDSHGLKERSPLLREQLRRVRVRARSADSRTADVSILDSGTVRGVRGGGRSFPGAIE